jgi:hypothetical protein
MGADPFNRYRSGGRTRSVLNLAAPDGVGKPAYDFTATTSAPTAPGDGYANPGLQKNLHVIFKNNAAGTCKFTFYLYHSFAEEWGNLHTIDPDAGTDTIIEVTVAANLDQYYIIPIEGAERVAVRCTTYAGGNDVTCYLGANTI